MAKTVAFFGLGNMGGPMAANLVKAGYRVRAFDPVPASVAAAVAAGCSAASDEIAAVQDADVVISMLPNGELVEALFLHQTRLLERLSPSTLVIDCSTIAAETSRRVAAAGAEVHPDERLGPFPFPQFKLHVLPRVEAPVAAWDHEGRDVLEAVSRVDGRYSTNVARTAYAGLADPHWVEFELSESAAQAEHLRVLLTGWFYYFESTSLWAISQRPDLGLQWPEIQGLVGDEWRSLAVAGVPPGKHKTIVVDLTGRFLSASREVRVATTMRVDHS